MIKDIRREIMPMWYDLDFDIKSASIVIRLHPKAFEFICNRIKRNAPIIVDFISQFNFPNFITPINPNWGFGEIIKTTNGKNRINMMCELPVIKNGNDINWDKSFAVSATLNLLFSALLILDKPTNSSQSQLLIIENMRTEEEIYGGALSVSISPTICKWINDFPDEYNHSEISEAMRIAFQKMWQDEVSFMDRFIALSRQPKWINLDIPGNACGLDPEDYRDGENLDKGYTLLPHNTDSPLHQLTLLSGIAKLNQLVRESEAIKKG